MKIYTKTGDKGKTSLFDGRRVFKYDIRVETYGTIDEVNSVLGVVLSSVSKSSSYYKSFFEIIILIQHDLFEIGARLANPSASENSKLLTRLTQHTSLIEKEIDRQTDALPALTNFILPGGGTVGALLQLARTVSRRAERRIVELSQKEPVEKEILIYVNRLSDLVHTMSRYANYHDKKPETIWVSQTQ